MEDTIEVAPSADNGNIPVETPSEQPKTETPAEKVETAQPAEPKEAELVELPDGRKVDASTVAQEYKNLLSDYTRKSQALAEIEKGKTINSPTEKPYEKPDYQPQTYAEIIQAAKQEVFGEMEAREKAKVEQEKAIENTVVTQLTELKTADPQLNENALFVHATKYGFRDLKLAHQNMKDMSEMAKKVQTTTAANIAKRNDPVSIQPGATGAKSNPSQFGNAMEFYRSLQK